jgi:hypothetical protein
MNYKIIKLNNGEEIIANVQENTESIIVDRPMVFVTSTMTDPVGRPVDVTFLKDWLSHSDNKTIEIEKNKVVMMAEAGKKSIEFYDMEINKNTETVETIVDGDQQPLDEFIEEMDRIMNSFLEGDSSVLDPNQSLRDEVDENYANEYEEQEQKRRRKRKKKKKKTSMENMIPEELQDRPMIYLNMIIPPEAIMNMVSSGIIDPDVLQEMIDQVKKRNKFTGDEKDRKDFGNKLTDWNPDPSSDDYK